MLTRLDWYILKKFLITFVFCMLLFTVIAVAVDSSEKTDDFVKANLTTNQIIFWILCGFHSVYLGLALSVVCFYCGYFLYL